MPGPFFIPRSRLQDTSSATDDKSRNKDFENTVGNLLVAEYQVSRLRQRLRDYNMSSNNDSESSEFVYKLGEEWFRISITAERYTPPKNDDKEEDEEEKQQRGVSDLDELSEVTITNTNTATNNEQSTGFAP